MNRRTFLAFAGAACLVDAQTPSRYRYVANGRDAIDVYALRSSVWKRIGQVSSHAPVSVALHPSGRWLYAANHVARYEGLPRGTVEVFAIDRNSGTPRPIQRQPLSLSGTEPRGLAVSPDGRFLAVAIYGGGAYNVLPVRPDGALGLPSSIFKELGSSVHPEHQAAAHPHTVLFDPAGHNILTSDVGCDQLSVFQIDRDGQLERRSRLTVDAGSGPGSLRLDPEGRWLYVAHELKGGSSRHRYNPANGTISRGLNFDTLLRKTNYDG